MEPKLKELCAKALEACINGRVDQSLKILYQAENRGKVDWTLFPSWAIPNAETESCHEG